MCHDSGMMLSTHVKSALSLGCSWHVASSLVVVKNTRNSLKNLVTSYKKQLIVCSAILSLEFF
jgi:hypothetical protein